MPIRAALSDESLRLVPAVSYLSGVAVTDPPPASQSLSVPPLT